MAFFETQRDIAQRYLGRNLDLILALGMLGIVTIIFVQLPTWVMDVLLATNITISVIVLLASVYLVQPLEFAVFPSLLLVTTAFRLALNIATTRLILGNAKEYGLEAAGSVIRAFGEFVAGGNVVIGFVVFVIIVIIQFVVITKGANRISEVAARFMLDAMPGKQMAIDADLNAGLIKEAEARKRREMISREADFYGAMDGATKFVRGDAIAGIIITIVNIIGGFIIGVVQYGMSAGQALDLFARLTIGDGLVTQIPALLISISAGIVVSRATAESHLGRDLLAQLFSHPRTLYITSFFLLMVGMPFTGLPTLPLWTLAVISALIGYNLDLSRKEARRKEVEEKQKEVRRRPEQVDTLLKVDPMEMEIGYGLIKMVDVSQGGVLLERITMMRRQFALDLGIVVPPIRIRDNMQLGANEYVVKIRGVKVGGGVAYADQYLAMDSGIARGRIEGIETREPAFGMPAWWVTEAQRKRAEALGYTVVDATTVVATHLTEIIKAHAAELLTREDVQNLLNTLKQTAPSLVDEVVPNLLKVGELQKVLQNLLREGISIRDLGTILETLGDYAHRTKDLEVLTEYVRNSLARYICSKHQAADGKIYVITMDPKLEDLIRNGTERTETGSFLTLAPKVISRIVERIKAEAEKLILAGHHPTILCSPQIRAIVKRIANNAMKDISVLSYNEIVKDVPVESVAMLALD